VKEVNLKTLEYGRGLEFLQVQNTKIVSKLHRGNDRKKKIKNLVKKGLTESIVLSGRIYM